MTKRDYIAAAIMLRRYRPAHPAMIVDIAEFLCDLFEADNPRFSREKFMAAVSRDDSPKKGRQDDSAEDSD